MHIEPTHVFASGLFLTELITIRNAQKNTQRHSEHQHKNTRRGTSENMLFSVTLPLSTKQVNKYHNIIITTTTERIYFD